MFYANVKAGPWSDDIHSRLLEEFNIEVEGHSNLMDAVYNTLVGTANTRFGPKPNPESAVVIRQTITECIEAGKPIPVRIPWGSRKPNLKYSVDIGELYSVRTMLCVANKVKALYGPGLDMYIMLEDTGGRYMFQSEGNELLRSSAKYCTDMEQLVWVMDDNKLIRPVRESTLMCQTEFDKVADGIVPFLYAFLQESDNLLEEDARKLESFKCLVDLGWKGVIPQPQREYYRGLHARNFPGATLSELNMIQAKYLGQALARHTLKGLGNKDGGAFVQLNFANPIPGVPKDLAERRIHYRSIPAKYTRTHIPAWRGRGIFQIENDEITPVMRSWHDDLRVYEGRVHLTRAQHAVTVQADYQLLINDNE